MLLVDEGLVSLDAHPKKYLPEAEGFDERVTIRQMLYHTSGLPDFCQTEEFAKKYTTESPTDDRALTKIITAYPQFFEPNTGARYCTSNFTYCALIIENIAKMPYAEYMRERVFLPLGMKNTFVDYEGKFIPNRVSGHTRNEKGEIVPIKRGRFAMFGGGDIVSTVDDVYKLNGAIKHRKLLSEKSWKDILSRSSVSYHTMGLGCNILDWHGKTRIQHNGGHRGFRTLHIQVLEDDFDIIILSNCEFGACRDIFPEYIYECFYGENSEPTLMVEMDKGYI
jgi:CubicO group peptidase (beta-lactamase class C family)